MHPHTQIEYIPDGELIPVNVADDLRTTNKQNVI